MRKIIIASLALLLAGALFTAAHQRLGQKTAPTQPPPAVDPHFYRGIITAADDSCVVDGNCSITVDGQFEITVGQGWNKGVEPQGRLIGLELGELEKYIGRQAEMRIMDYDFLAAKKHRQYLVPTVLLSLYGHGENFVRVLNE